MKTLPKLLMAAGMAFALALPPAGCAGRAEFSGKAAYDSLNKQVSFGPRVPGTEAHDACRDYFVNALKPLADAVQVQHFEYRRTVQPAAYRRQLKLSGSAPAPRSGPIPMDNVIAVVNGTDGKPPRLLLCAHWDSRPTADMETSAVDRVKPISGANDGASGAAILVELARVFHAKRPTQGVILALLDGEDLGPGVEDMLLGAKHYAQHPLPVKPKEGILLDMVGDADLTIYKEGNSLDANRALTETIFSTAARLGYAKQFVPELKYTMEDDHLPLIQAGIPTVDLIDFDYPAWHTLRDTADQCSAESLEAVGRTMAAVVYARK